MAISANKLLVKQLIEFGLSEKEAKTYLALLELEVATVRELPKALHKDTKQKPKIRVFEGKRGLINAFEDSLNNEEKLIRIYSSPSNLEKIIPDYLIQYVHKRFRLGIKMYGIHSDNKIHRQYIEKSPRNFDKPILIPEKKYKFPVDFAVF